LRLFNAHSLVDTGTTSTTNSNQCPILDDKVFAMPCGYHQSLGILAKQPPFLPLLTDASGDEVGDVYVGMSDLLSGCGRDGWGAMGER
jgi:hypothetical protein